MKISEKKIVLNILNRKVTPTDYLKSLDRIFKKKSEKCLKNSVLAAKE